MNSARVFRAVLGTAISWGVLWSLLSIPSLTSLVSGGPPGVPTSQLVWAWLSTSWSHAFAQGAVLGTGFAMLMLVASSRVRSFQRLSYALIGTLGAVASAALTLILLGTGIGLFNILLTTALGAVSSAASLAVARRSPVMLPQHEPSMIDQYKRERLT